MRKSVYQLIELIPEEMFKQEHEEWRDSIDEHGLMIARLKHEETERANLAKEEAELKAKRDKLTKELLDAKAEMDLLDKDLEAFLKASLPLQEKMNVVFNPKSAQS
ncbi:hypothetical protein HDU96_001315 [Phlyctochytrium bullatum]|nr:hypothetical protein HDU96_001315 [Phlyctochytrium bullatum]